LFLFVWSTGFEASSTDADYESSTPTVHQHARGAGGIPSLAEHHICSVCNLLAKKALFCQESGTTGAMKQGEFTALMCQHLMASSTSANADIAVESAPMDM
jgi:hypothetical protein